MFFKLNSLSAFIFYFNRSKLETRLLEFVNLSVSPKVFYSSATVLVLMFFKLNSLSALIFYFNDSKLETRQGKEKSLHYTTEVQFMFCMFSHRYFWLTFTVYMQQLASLESHVLQLHTEVLFVYNKCCF